MTPRLKSEEDRETNFAERKADISSRETDMKGRETDMKGRETDAEVRKEDRDSRKSDMHEFVTQMKELATSVGNLDKHLSLVENWAKKADEKIENADKILRGDKDAPGLMTGQDRLNNRVNTIFAIFASLWALFLVVFSVVIKVLFDKFAQLMTLVK